MEQKDHNKILRESVTLESFKRLLQELNSLIPPIHLSIAELQHLILTLETPDNTDEWRKQAEEIIGAERYWGNDGLRTLPLSLRLSTPIEALVMSMRPRKVLGANNIRTVLQLLQTPLHTLLHYENFGKKSLSEIKFIIQELDLMDQWIHYSGTSPYRLHRIVPRALWAI